MVKRHRKNEGEEQGLLTPCREKSLTSMVRMTLALGNVVIEERVTHLPAEDRDLGHTAGQRTTMRTSYQGACRHLTIFCSLSDQPGPSHTEQDTHPGLIPRTLQGYGSAQEQVTKKQGQVGSSPGPASDPSLSKSGNLSELWFLFQKTGRGKLASLKSCQEGGWEAVSKH